MYIIEIKIYFELLELGTFYRPGSTERWRAKDQAWEPTELAIRAEERVASLPARLVGGSLQPTKPSHPTDSLCPFLPTSFKPLFTNSTSHSPWNWTPKTQTWVTAEKLWARLGFWFGFVSDGNYQQMHLSIWHFWDLCTLTYCAILWISLSALHWMAIRILGVICNCFCHYTL